MALYGSAQWLVDNQIITDPRALIAIQLLSPAIFVVTILSCFRGYFQGFQYMVPTGTSQVFEQIFRVSSMVGLAYYFIDRGLHLAAGGATFATFPGVLAGLLVLIYFYYRQRNVREKMLFTNRILMLFMKVMAPWLNACLALLYLFLWRILCFLWYHSLIHLSSQND